METIADLSYDAYMLHQLAELHPDRLADRAMKLTPSPSYRRNGKGWVPQSYPGFAVISMVDENPGNENLPAILKAIQAHLLEQCPWEELICLLPAESFHQTIANTLSEQRFLNNILHPGLEPVYPSLVAEAFGRLPARRGNPLSMRLAGLGIFGTALGLLGVFDNESHYHRILDFRSAIYSDEGLTELDVRMTRPFIGHLTLAYIGGTLTTGQSEELAAAVVAINENLDSNPPRFLITQTGLRRYHHLSAFLREENYPRFHF